MWSALITAGFAQTVQVPLNHWVYDLLERWETQGRIEQVYDHTRPYTRQETAEYLAEVFRAYSKAPGRFGSYDRQYLQYCAEEFAEELQQNRVDVSRFAPVNRFRALRERTPLKSLLPKFVYRNNRNFADAQHEEFSIYVDPILQYSSYSRVDHQDTLADFTHISNGLTFRGALGNYLGFYFMLFDNRLTRDPGFPLLEVLEESGLPYHSVKGSDALEYNENTAYLTLTYKYFNLLFGRGYNRWGGGHRGNLMLSTNAPLYDQVKFTIRYWRFKFTHLTAFTQYIPPGGRKRIKAVDPIDTYWAGNRLEVYLGKGVQLGLAESVVYGNQSLQPGYLNPLSFYKSIEHYNGDRDNGALGVDLAWRVRPGVKIYGELFIDDLTTTKLGTSWFGNKFAYQAGLFWVDPLPRAANDVLIEYARIKPYVYSHSVQDYNKYKNYDTVLGHYIGSNSDDWYLRWRVYPRRRLRLQIDYEAYRHGSNPEDRNVGGDPDQPFIFGVDNPASSFLDGIRVERSAVGGEMRYELLRNTFVNVQFYRIQDAAGATHSTFNFRIGYNFGSRPETIRPFEAARR